MFVASGELKGVLSKLKITADLIITIENDRMV